MGLIFKQFQDKWGKQETKSRENTKFWKKNPMMSPIVFLKVKNQKVVHKIKNLSKSISNDVLYYLS